MLRTIKQSSGVFLLLALLGSVVPLPEKPGKMYVSGYENVLGTSLELKIAAMSAQQAARAEDAALAEIDRLNHILSSYDSTSEFCRWMKADKKPVTVSPELYEVLSLFEQWRLKSKGALDAAAETVSKVWAEAAKKNRLPPPGDIAGAVEAVRQPHYMLNKQNHTVTRLSDASLILNSFAKSYIMNKASHAAMGCAGVTALVMNIGGDILVRGGHTEQIRVSDPKADAENSLPVAAVSVRNKTIATSGNYRRGVLIGGKWYSHIVDPRTGWPAGEVISATVVADSAADAGALATALNVLGPDEGSRLAASVPGAEYLLIMADGRQVQSRGWEKIKILEALTRDGGDDDAVRPPVKDKMWDPDYELVVSLQLATVEGVRIHRPFVAVWVIDAYKKPVKQLAVWYGKSRWLTELSSWHYAYYQDFSAGNSSIMSTTSATRPPGKYTLRWDGRDDKGNLLPQGSYTVYMEAAREQGTHQLMSKEIIIQKPQHIDMAGGTEIAAASLDYRKKTDGK